MALKQEKNQNLGQFWWSNFSSSPLFNFVQENQADWQIIQSDLKPNALTKFLHMLWRQNKIIKKNNQTNAVRCFLEVKKVDQSLICIFGVQVLWFHGFRPPLLPQLINSIMTKHINDHFFNTKKFPMITSRNLCVWEFDTIRSPETLLEKKTFIFND